MPAIMPNPFITDSAASLFRPVADTAVASNPSPHAPDAAAGPISESSTAQEDQQEAPAVFANPLPAGATDLLGCDISNVGEIFLFAKILCAQARLRPGTISPEAVSIAEEIQAYEDIYDPPPLFLQMAAE